jgi:hypothetical protein
MSILPTAKTGVSPTHAEEIVHTVNKPDAQTAVARAAVKTKLVPDEIRELSKRMRNELKAKPDASKKFLNEKANRFAKEIKRSRQGLYGYGRPFPCSFDSCFVQALPVVVR